MGPEHYGKERWESTEAKAENLVQMELKRLKWEAMELSQRAKGDASKIALAMRLRRETVMPVKWIAERLQMGTTGYVNHLLYQHRKTGKPSI